MTRTARAGLAALLAWGPAAHAGQTVVLWHAYRGAEETALTQVVDAYEAAHPDVTVETLGVPYEALASKLTTAIPRDNGPDVFVFAHERVGGWTHAGLLRPVADWATAPSADTFLPASLPPLTVDGALMGLPLASKSVILFRNTDLVPEAPATVDALVASAEAHTGPGRFGLAYEAESFYFHAPWYFGLGGTLAAEPPLVDFTSAPFVDSLAFVDGLQEAHVMPDEATGALVAQLFNEGRAAFVVSGPWFLGEIGDVPYALSPLPAFPSGPARPFMTEEAVFVSATAAHPDAGAALASWLAGPEAAVVRATVGRQVVASAAAWDDPALASDPVLSAFRDQLPDTVPMDNRPQMRDVWEPAQLALKKVLRGDASAAEAGAAAARRLSAITAPTPAPANPTPYLGLLATAVLGGLAVLWRWVAGVRAQGALGDTLRAWTWIAPAMAAVLVLVFVPFATGIGISLFAHDEGTWTFVGLANFRAIVTGQYFPLLHPLGFVYTLLVTVLWTAANVVLHLALGLFLALLLNRKGLALRPVYRVLLILPWAVPNYITALIWKGLFHKQFGAINGLLEALGLQGVSWFSSFPTAFAANLCTNVWLGFPFMMVVCLGALQAIPSELYEAAEVDGAGAWDRFRHVTLPLLQPALVPAVLLGTVWTFNQFNIVYLVSGGEPDGATEILISEAYRWAFTRQERFGYAAAYAVLIFVVLLGWSAVSTRLARRAEEAAR
ncbi:MAG: extracellular solute-binding protein [Alphaproteobacteria bacterium]|nr:extracellular solute-binding protein [Alphaproteobacteria bacterium]